jgi:HAD superfamily hydrolase (TIGR01509 family)
MNQTSERNQIQAVVFDLDGLMFNTEEIFNEVGDQLLIRRGKEMTPELRTQMMGRRGPESFAVMVDWHGLRETVEELLVESEILFRQLAVGRLAPMPGLHTLLDAIESRKLKKGVATSSPRRYFHEIIEPFQLLHRFDVTLTAEDVTHGKPHPEVYLTAAERLGVQPCEMLVLEDSHTGSLAAARANAVAVAIPHRHSSYQNFDHVHFVAERLDDPRILKLLTELEQTPDL